MDHNPSNPPPPVPADRAHWTPEKQRAFLMQLLDTGCVAKAARHVGMSRNSAHRLRKRLAGTPFDHHWSHALKVHARRQADPFGPDAMGRPAAPPAPDSVPPTTAPVR
jgi:hypothetical protein